MTLRSPICQSVSLHLVCDYISAEKRQLSETVRESSAEFQQNAAVECNQ